MDKTVVSGEGSNNPKVVFVGEAPGRNEEVQGRPFVGRAGQVLRSTIKEIELEEKDYYITNLVKIRPPGNRDPTLDEVKEWFPKLKSELVRLNPKIICSLGAHSTKYLISNGNFENIDGESISKHRGNFKEIKLGSKNYILFPTYHPAATIYRKELKSIFVEDLKKLKNSLSADTTLDQS